MTPVIVENYYCSTDTHLGTSDTSGITDAQIHNATLIYEFFSGSGWSTECIAGLLGNMQVESFLSPAYIQDTNRWRLPNAAAELSDVPNEVMQNFYMQYYHVTARAFGVGLIQWDGLGITRQKLVGWCMNNGYNWYSGDAQCRRIIDEKTRLSSETWPYPVQIHGVKYTWANVTTSTANPEYLCEALRAGWIRGGDQSKERRATNARWWYEYFQGSPPGPEPPEPPDPPEPPEPEPFPPWPPWLLSIYFKKRTGKERIIFR